MGLGFPAMDISAIEHLDLGPVTYPNDILNLLFVGRSILSEEIICIGLGWGIRVRVIQQVLNTQ